MLRRRLARRYVCDDLFVQHTCPCMNNYCITRVAARWHPFSAVCQLSRRNRRPLQVSVSRPPAEPRDTPSAGASAVRDSCLRRPGTTLIATTRPQLPQLSAGRGSSDETGPQLGTRETQLSPGAVTCSCCAVGRRATPNDAGCKVTLNVGFVV